MDVQLYVYDLSQGLARQMSHQFLGTQIDAVYHTSIVIDGIEYFFGAGIQSCRAGTTHHGRPMETIQMGKTELPLELILEYLESLKSIYTAESYDLFLHNCNNFSNDFSMFLVGKNIPDHITTLPQTVLNTPFGQMLRPMLDQSMRPITQATVPNQSTIRPNGVSQSQAASARVQNIRALSELQSILSSASDSCAVIFFTSSTCGPCKILYPTYDELATSAGDKAVLIKVDINFAQEIAAKYNVRATPTIMTFLKGEKDEEWAGADVNRLRTTVERLVRMAHPPHPHINFPVSALVEAAGKPVRYTKIPPLDKLIAKLGKAADDPIISSMKQFISGLDKTVKQDNPLPSLPSFATFLTNSITTVPPDSLFAAYDLLRAALIDIRVAAFFAEGRWRPTIATLIAHVTSLSAAAPYSLRIVAVQLACNLLASRVAASMLVSSSSSAAAAEEEGGEEEGGGSQELLRALVALASASLLDADHATARVAAAGLAFNVATASQVARAKMGSEAVGWGEEVQIELVAAVVEALRVEESSKEAVAGLVMALGLLVYMAPMDGEVLDLCRALDVPVVVRGKQKLIEGAGVKEAVEILTKGLNAS